MWLLDSNALTDIEAARGFEPTTEQLSEFRDFVAKGPSITKTLGETARITVSGVLTKRPSLMARLFGGGNTTYPDISSALFAAEADPKVSDIVLEISSPGGSVDGLFELIADMQGIKKPMKTEASKATSAAYAIASQTSEIVATGPASSFGSIGVAVDATVYSEDVSITSTKAPKKRPDLKTEEGRAVVREELDALHDLFVDAIASGRGVSADKINAKFGEGAVLLAGEALKRGMIDSINTKQPAAATGGKKREARSMDLQTLKAQHPSVYAAAVQEGRDQERDRVMAHLTMGQASGDMKTAIDAAENGSAMTATLQAKYLAAGMCRSDQRKRAADDADTAAGADNTQSASSSDESDAKVAASILAHAAELCGVELGGD